VIRDAHGDLRLDHVLHFPDRAPPDDLIAVDCIEFNDQLRFIDPVADLAFLAMDLSYHGRRDLARAFCRAYFNATGDRDGERLLPLFIAYRAAVRGAVEGFKAADRSVPEAERERTRSVARARWLLALTELEEPSRRPCLVLVAGLPGSGKSTLARQLGERAGFSVIRSDEVRKELAGLDPNQPTPSDRIGEVYSSAASDRTYDECQRRAEALLFEGKRVLVDANFRGERRRRAFLDAARRWAVPALLLVCRADPEVVRSRLAGRQGDASDADWTVYQKLAAEWEQPGAETRPTVREIDTSGPIDMSLAQATAALGDLVDA
jgi:predicted kinase